MPTVRPATTDELPAVGAALAAAFADDPLWGWMTPSSPHWVRRATDWFTTEATAHHRDGATVLVDDDVRGAAIWCPPGRWRASGGHVARIAVPSLRLFGTRTPRSIRAIRALDGVHPDAEHWYLAYVGTDPAHQGHGIGGALVRSGTDRCDDEGLPAYLESSKEANVAFYTRHGFAAHDAVEPGGGPPVWPMWREAPR